MRLWPMRRRPTPATPPPDDVLVLGDTLRRNVDDILAVYDNAERNGVFLFRGQLAITPARALEILRERFGRFGYTPYIRPERGGVGGVGRRRVGHRRMAQPTTRASPSCPTSRAMAARTAGNPPSR